MVNDLGQPVSICAHACSYLVSTPCLCTFVFNENKRCLNLNYPMSICSNFQSVLQSYIQQKNLELLRASIGVKKHVVPTFMEDGHFHERLCPSVADQGGVLSPWRTHQGSDICPFLWLIHAVLEEFQSLGRETKDS